jgi:hypothetical protein
MSPDEVMDAMRDLLQGLSIGPAVAGAAADTVYAAAG